MITSVNFKSFAIMDYLKYYLRQSLQPATRTVVTPTGPTNKCLTYFFKVYFDVAYCLCVSPYRIVIQTQPNGGAKIITKSWWLHTFLCLIITILGAVWIVRDVRLCIPKDWKNPSLYFVMFLKVDVAVKKVFFLKLFWFNRQDFVNLFNFILDPKNSVPAENFRRVSEKTIARLLCLMYIFNAAVETVTGHTTGASMGGMKRGGWDAARWWKSMVESGRYNFYLSGGHSSMSTNLSHITFHNFTTAEHILGVMSTIGFFNR